MPAVLALCVVRTQLVPPWAGHFRMKSRFKQSQGLILLALLPGLRHGALWDGRTCCLFLVTFGAPSSLLTYPCLTPAVCLGPDPTSRRTRRHCSLPSFPTVSIPLARCWGSLMGQGRGTTSQGTRLTPASPWRAGEQTKGGAGERTGLSEAAPASHLQSKRDQPVKWVFCWSASWCF